MPYRLGSDIPLAASPRPFDTGMAREGVVGQPSRAEVAKLSDVAQLRRMLDRYDLTTPVHDDDLSIDNSELSPEETAAAIAGHAGLDLLSP